MNFGTPVPLLIGIVLILGAVALFFLDKLKPGYGRDADKVYAVLWLISGVFLLGHLNMELLASFQQLILTGMLIAVTIENVSSRTPRDERYGNQAMGNDPGRDYYRPSRSQEYRPASPRMNVRAEIDKEEPYRPRFPEDRRMLEGRREPASRRSDYYDDGYGDRYGDDRNSAYSDRDSFSSERPMERLNPGSDRIRRRRPKTADSRYGGAPSRLDWDESATGYAANSGSGYSSHSNADDAPYPQSNGRNDDSYVDYRPVNYPSDDSNQQPPSDYNSGRY